MRLAAFGQLRRSRGLTAAWSDTSDLFIPPPFPSPHSNARQCCPPTRSLSTKLRSRSSAPRPTPESVSTRSRRALISRSSSPAKPRPAELASLQSAPLNRSTFNSLYFKNAPITTNLTPPTPPAHKHSHRTRTRPVKPKPSKLQPTPTPLPGAFDPLSASTLYPSTLRPIMIHAVEVASIAGYNKHIPINHTFTAVWRRTEPKAYTALSRGVVTENEKMADVIGQTSIPQRMRELRPTLADITPRGIQAVYGELEERVDREVKPRKQMEEEQREDDVETSAQEPAAVKGQLSEQDKLDRAEVNGSTADTAQEKRKAAAVDRPRSRVETKATIAERRRSAAHSDRQKEDEVREKLKDHVRQKVRTMYGVEKEKAVIKAMRAKGQIVKQNNQKLYKRIMGISTATPLLTLTPATTLPQPATAVALSASDVRRVWILGGRVDGFVNGELIEIKNRTVELKPNLPNKDKCQFLVYLHILGLDRGRLVELIRGGREHERRKETVVVREDEGRLWSRCLEHLRRLVDFLCAFMADDARQRAYVLASEAEQELMLKDVWPKGYVAHSTPLHDSVLPDTTLHDAKLHDSTLDNRTLPDATLHGTTQDSRTRHGSMQPDTTPHDRVLHDRVQPDTTPHVVALPGRTQRRQRTVALEGQVILRQAKRVVRSTFRKRVRVVGRVGGTMSSSERVPMGAAATLPEATIVLEQSV